jgi:hypothetical protein
MILRRSWCLTGAAVLIGLWTAPAVAQPVIVLDYTFDTNNFFPIGSQQRTTLQTAATMLTSRMTDSLMAITPNVPAGNTWTPSFFHPGTGATQTLTNPTIAANEIRVFAGGRDLPGSTLGQGGPGGFGVGGDQTWFDTVVARGQPGALLGNPTDFGPWGGAITFDTVGPNWHFGLNAPSGSQADFLSVALHELGHLLGFGLAESWTNLVAGGTFTGPVSSGLFGSNVPVSGGHWADGTQYLGQETAMDPSILLGTRKVFTELDYAGLDDLGWQITPVPEPTTVVGVAVGLAGLGGLIRRFRKKSEGAETAPATTV